MDKTQTTSQKKHQTTITQYKMELKTTIRNKVTRIGKKVDSRSQLKKERNSEKNILKRHKTQLSLEINKVFNQKDQYAIS